MKNIIISFGIFVCTTMNTSELQADTLTAKDIRIGSILSFDKSVLLTRQSASSTIKGTGGTIPSGTTVTVRSVGKTDSEVFFVENKDIGVSGWSGIPLLKVMSTNVKIVGSDFRANELEEPAAQPVGMKQQFNYGGHKVTVTGAQLVRNVGSPGSAKGFYQPAEEGKKLLLVGLAIESGKEDRDVLVKHGFVIESLDKTRAEESIKGAAVYARHHGGTQAFINPAAASPYIV